MESTPPYPTCLACGSPTLPLADPMSGKSACSDPICAAVHAQHGTTDPSGVMIGRHKYIWVLTGARLTPNNGLQKPAPADLETVMTEIMVLLARHSIFRMYTEQQIACYLRYPMRTISDALAKLREEDRVIEVQRPGKYQTVYRPR